MFKNLKIQFPLSWNIDNANVISISQPCYNKHVRWTNIVIEISNNIDIAKKIIDLLLINSIKDVDQSMGVINMEFSFSESGKIMKYNWNIDVEHILDVHFGELEKIDNDVTVLGNIKIVIKPLNCKLL